MAATIRDVARTAGVHISTVSRSFSAPHLVNTRTRSRVLETADELGYRPNRAARALVTGRTQNVGLIVADLANPFFPPMIKGAESQARLQGCHVFVADTDEDAQVEEDLVRTLVKQVDGVLLCSPRMNNGLVDQLSKVVPLVVVNRSIDGLPCVVPDVARGARDALAHLLDLGHRRLALLGGPRGSWTNRQIRNAVAASARTAAATVTMISPNPPTERGGAAAAEHVARSGVTGVLAYNDLMAVGLLEGLEAHGLTAPNDISVVGFDDIALSRRSRPALTTVAMPTVAAGRAAVDLFQRQYTDKRHATGRVTLPTELIVRESTGPCPSEPAAPR